MCGLTCLLLLLLLPPPSRPPHVPPSRRPHARATWSLLTHVLLLLLLHLIACSKPRLRYRIHSFEHQGFVIWGLTASILIQVARRALGREPSFEVDTPGGVPAEHLWYDGNNVGVRPLELGPVAPDPALEDPAAAGDAAG